MAPASRGISITLTRRRVVLHARLLDDRAPRTCQAIWDSLPFEGDCAHSRYARHQIYTLVPGRFEPPPENTTITPFTGDLVYWPVPVGSLPDPGAYPADTRVLMDIGVYYDRNNLLLSPDTGWQPNTVFGLVDRGLEELAAAAVDVWRAGAVGETLRFERSG
ncbi:MAG TPA: DUF3830 family protein [Mycobacteriales bacterium]|nr:DUF3830 family protein [Mycobacteriales bacterium]